MKMTLGFDDLGKNDVKIAGGKGASLGEMTRAGIPVPQGFVILASVFDQFLHETSLKAEIEAQLNLVNYEDISSVERASRVIHDLIHDARFPKDIETEVLNAFHELNSEFVAVRSSATAEDSSTASWAGELESYLNTTEKCLLGNVKKCWASLFTPRAIVYRNEKGMRNTHVSVAVVVQKMIESEVSGITFTVHPITRDNNQLITEAGFGLGEAIVSGQVTPDSYVVEKEPLRIIDKKISSQIKMLVKKAAGGNEWTMVPYSKRSTQKLPDELVLSFSKLFLQIEEHYGFPCDIEWAVSKDMCFILQSRPITTLTSK